ncbi:hypothetical protein [Bartonella sp. CB178]|uniref:hypothetical protein n=1 Tax=Bartonella sp. CB178 TaxID=3112255 RepID=UPI00300DF9EB
MNVNNHTVNRTVHDESSSFAVKKKGDVNELVEMRMSDIARKLHHVSTQMQIKHSPRHSALQRPEKDNFKSYLDDISRAILAEYHVRRQKEKMLFEHLEQIKTLVQTLYNEKTSPQRTSVGSVSRSRFPNSVVHHLARMAEGQRGSSVQESSDISGASCIASTRVGALGTPQKGKKKTANSGNAVLP